MKVLLAVLVLCAAVAGQEDFDRLYDRARQTAGSADASAAQEAWAEALHAFLLIPPDAASYAPRLLAGAEAALGAGRAAMALDLVTESIARDGTSEARRAVQLRSLVKLEDAAGFLTAAGGDLPPALLESLERDWDAKLALLGWADGWLRASRTEDALWLFGQLARSEAPIDLANLALALRNAGREAESAQAYRRALDAAPDDPVLWNDYGLSLKGVMRAEEALAAFRRSYALEPVPGEGPAITNLAAMALLRPDLLPDPPLDEVRRAFVVRESSTDPLVRRSEMLRRLTLDLLLERGKRPFQASAPDRRPIPR